MPGLFHSTQIAPNTIEAEGEVREFKGDGSPLLKVPGLTKVLSVHVGRVKIPLERDYKFPLNSDAERKEKVRTTLPHVVLAENEASEKVLLRSKHSNDGNWQDGAKIFVGGEWEDSEAESDPSTLPALDASTAGVTTPPVSNGKGKPGASDPATS